MEWDPNGEGTSDEKCIYFRLQSLRRTLKVFSFPIIPSVIWYFLSSAATQENADDYDFTDIENQVLYLSSTWDDISENLMISGVQSYQECYRRCLVTNGDRCFLFKYKLVLYNDWEFLEFRSSFSSFMFLLREILKYLKLFVKHSYLRTLSPWVLMHS